jgi:serine/threonine protein kinase
MKDSRHSQDAWTAIAVHRPDETAAHHHHLTRTKHFLASRELNDACSSNPKRGWPVFGIEHRPSLASVSTDRRPLIRSETSSMASRQIIPSSSQRSFTDKYGRCLEILHYGTNTTVRLHQHKTEAGKPRRLVAIKVYRYNILDSSSPVSNSTCDTLSIANLHPCHPNILSINDLLYNERSELCLVMPLCAGGDLHELLARHGPLPTPEADCIMAQILRALDFLHRQDTAHRDIRLETVLLTKSGAVKLAGFGDSHIHRLWAECATPREPDNILPNYPHPASSSWSFSWMLPSFTRSSPPRRAFADSAGSSASFPGMSLPYTPPEGFYSRSHRSQRDNSDQGTEDHEQRPADVWAAAITYLALITGRLLWRSARPDREDARYVEYLQGRRSEDGYPPIEALGNVNPPIIHKLLKIC